MFSLNKVHIYMSSEGFFNQLNLVHNYNFEVNTLNIMGRLHDKCLKITLSLNSRLTAVDCIKSGLTSLRLTLSLNSRLMAVDCMK